MITDSVHIEGKFNGYPYKGPALNLKKDDPAEKQPQLRHTVSVRQFDLGSPDDEKAYGAVCQGFADGKYICSSEQIHFDQAKGSYKIYLRWMEPWYGPPLIIEDNRGGDNG